MADALQPESFTFEVSDDGSALRIEFTSETEPPTSIELPAAIAVHFKDAFLYAIAEMLDRVTGGPPAAGTTRIAALEPRTFQASRVGDGAVLLVLDRSFPSQIAFRIPRGTAFHLSKRLRALSEEADDEPPSPKH